MRRKKLHTRKRERQINRNISVESHRIDRLGYRPGMLVRMAQLLTIRIRVVGKVLFG